MKKPVTNVLTPLAAGACLSFAFLANNAQAATQQYFDVNGTSPGYGTPTGSPYDWSDADWATASGGAAATANWVNDGSGFARFYGTGTYAINVGASENFAGMYVNAGTVTIQDDGSGNGALNIENGGQLFEFRSGTITYIDVPITSDATGGLHIESTGTVHLNAANTYVGGTALGLSGNTLTYFDNDSAFGTGGITLYRTANYSTLGATGGSALTIANDFTLNAASTSPSTGLHFANDANTPLTFSGTWSLGANSLVLKGDGGSGSPTTLSGAISGSGGLIVTAGSAGSKIVLSGASAGFTGATAVEGTAYSYGGVTGAAGILQFGIANAIMNSTGMTLAGGTLSPGGHDQIMAAAALTLSGGGVSTIDFSDGAALLEFADSHAATWSGTLNLIDYSTDDSTYGLDFGTSGLTAGQLDDIEFDGTGLGTATLTPDGFVAVPEPTTLALAGLGGLALLGFRRRKA